MLPFGLTTDVSAAALAAGAAGMTAGGFGLQGAGQVTGQATAGAKGSGFAIELKAAAGPDAGQTAGAEAAAADLSEKPAAATMWLQFRAGALEVATGTATPMPEGLALADGEIANAVKPAAPGVPVGEPAELVDAQSETPADAAMTAFAEFPVVTPPIAAALGAEAGAPLALTPGAGATEGSGPGNILPAGAANPGQLAGTSAGTASLLPDAGAGGEAGAGATANGGQTAGGTPQFAGAEASGELSSSADAFRQVPAGKDRRWQSELPQELRAQTYVPVRAATAVPAGGQPAAGPGLLPNGDGLPAAASERAANVITAVTPGTGATKPADLMPQQPLQAAVTTLAEPGQAGTAAAHAAQPSVPNVSAQPGAAKPDAKTGSKAAGIATSGTVAGAAAQAAAAQASAETAMQARNAAQGQAEALSAQLQPEDQIAAGAGDGEGEAPLAATLKADAVRTGQSALQRIGVDSMDPGLAPAARPVNLAAAAPAAMAAADQLPEETDLTLTRLEPGSAGEIGSATVRGGDLSGAARTESLQTPNQTQSAHVSGQVAAEIARNLKNGQTRFQMRFDPPELGRVEVHMKVKSDGSVQTHLIVDRPETLDMFLRDQRGLERALENAGLTPDSANMQFSLKQDGNRDFASGQDGAGGTAAEQGGSGAGGAEDSDPMAEDIVRLTLARQRGGLDMKV